MMQNSFLQFRWNHSNVSAAKVNSTPFHSLFLIQMRVDFQRILEENKTKFFSTLYRRKDPKWSKNSLSVVQNPICLRFTPTFEVMQLWTQ